MMSDVCGARWKPVSGQRCPVRGWVASGGGFSCPVVRRPTRRERRLRVVTVAAPEMKKMVENEILYADTIDKVKMKKTKEELD